jgi:hypothetical protein
MLWEIREIVNGSICTVNHRGIEQSGDCVIFTTDRGRKKALELPNYKITQLLNSYRPSSSLYMYLMAGL